MPRLAMEVIIIEVACPLMHWLTGRGGQEMRPQGESCHSGVQRLRHARTFGSAPGSHRSAYGA